MTDPYYIQYLYATPIAVALWVFLRGITHNSRIVKANRILRETGNKSLRGLKIKHWFWGFLNVLVSFLHAKTICTAGLFTWYFVWAIVPVMGYFLALTGIGFNIFLNRLRGKEWLYLSSTHPANGGAVTDWLFHKIPAVWFIIQMAVAGGCFYWAVVI